MKVVQKSEPLPMPPLVVSKSLEKNLRQRIKQALLHMHETSAGRDALGKVEIDRFVEPATDYRRIETMDNFLSEP